MSHVLLVSQLPWQRNDANTVPGVFLVLAYGSLYLPSLPRLWQIFNNFYDSVLKIFCNEVLRVIKMVSKHAIDIIG